MATTAVEQPKTRSDLAQRAGAGPVSPFPVLAGVLVGYATFALLVSGAIGYLHHRGSKLDLTGAWNKIGHRGDLLLGLLLLVSYLAAGYVAGRVAWRRGVVRGISLSEGATVDLDELSRDELYRRAQEEEVPGRSQMNKEELKQALQNQN